MTPEKKKFIKMILETTEPEIHDDYAIFGCYNKDQCFGCMFAKKCVEVFEGCRPEIYGKDFEIVKEIVPEHFI